MGSLTLVMGQAFVEVIFINVLLLSDRGLANMMILMMITWRPGVAGLRPRWEGLRHGGSVFPVPTREALVVDVDPVSAMRPMQAATANNSLEWGVTVPSAPQGRQ